MKWGRNLSLSISALSRARLRTLLSASSMMIGIAAVTLLFGVGAGAEQAYQAAIESMGKNLLSVGSQRKESGALRGVSRRYQTLTLDDWRAIKSELDSVALAAPIAMNNFDLRYGGESCTRVHGKGDFGYAFARVARDHRRTEDLVGAFLYVNLEKTFGLAFENRTINGAHFDAECVEFYTFLGGFVLVDADVSDFWIRVGTPGNVERARAATSEEERVLDDDARHRVSGVGELVGRTDVASGVDVAVGGL